MIHPRFTLRTLLMVVAVCAVGTQMLRPEPVPRDDLTAEMFLRVRIGMSKSEILGMYGPPHSGGPTGYEPEVWRYYPGFYVQELRDNARLKRVGELLGHHPRIVIGFERGKVVGVSTFGTHPAFAF